MTPRARECPNPFCRYAREELEAVREELDAVYDQLVQSQARAQRLVHTLMFLLGAGAERRNGQDAEGPPESPTP
jgi:hypothetical protein